MNFKPQLCTCDHSLALGTRTKLQLEIINIKVISSTHLARLIGRAHETLVGKPLVSDGEGCTFLWQSSSSPNSFSIQIFYLVINIEKHHLVKYRAISVLYQFITISIDLKICTMSKALKSKLIWRCCIHKTMGPHVTMVTQLIVSWN